MKLWRSRFVHLVPIEVDRVVAIDAIGGEQLALNAESAALIEAFDNGTEIAEVVAAFSARYGSSEDIIARAIAALLERRLLSRDEPEMQQTSAAQALRPLLGRDPAKSRAADYWRVRFARAPADLAGGREYRLLLIGECDVHIEADFIEMEAPRHGFSLRVLTLLPADLGAARDVAHDAILLGLLNARHWIALGTPADHGGDPTAAYLAEVDAVLRELRTMTSAPILVAGLPAPTVQPLGRAERGRYGHRNRFRGANLALAELCEGFADLHFIDTEAALAEAGVTHLLDDALVHFTHFGSCGWLLQRPPAELEAVHHRMPPPDPLAQRIGDPYTRERAMAREHVLALRAVLGIGRLKCLAVDLDGVLWPGVLAETGAPFAWRPEISGAYSFVGVYFGIHDALKALQRRGILLACVSRNDESVVESLWRYAPNDPVDRLLSPDDFVTRRISWGEKSAAVTDIAVELGVALEAMGFIDDNPVERAEVQEALPSVALFGDDIYRLRHDLLTDPRLSPMRVTREATSRSSTLLARLERERLAQTAVDRDAFISGLEIKLDIRRAERSEELIRVAELFARTTQLNATGVTFTEEVLAMIVKGPPRDMVVALNYRDRFGDQGLVGAAVVQDGEIVNIAMSCRVIGLGVQTAMLRWIIRELRHYLGSLVARIVPTDRNAPVRDVYAQAGFQPGPAGSWRFTLQSVDVADGT